MTWSDRKSKPKRKVTKKHFVIHHQNFLMLLTNNHPKESLRHNYDEDSTRQNSNYQNTRLEFIIRQKLNTTIFR